MFYECLQNQNSLSLTLDTSRRVQHHFYFESPQNSVVIRTISAHLSIKKHAFEWLAYNRGTDPTFAA